jgi:hypothetical protein
VQWLHVSTYTLQEHLRGAFDKFGMGSRRKLITALLAPHRARPGRRGAHGGQDGLTGTARRWWGQQPQL